jgi:hypothetical protein
MLFHTSLRFGQIIGIAMDVPSFSYPKYEVHRLKGWLLHDFSCQIKCFAPKLVYIKMQTKTKPLEMT